MSINCPEIARKRVRWRTSFRGCKPWRFFYDKFWKMKTLNNGNVYRCMLAMLQKKCFDNCCEIEICLFLSSIQDCSLESVVRFPERRDHAARVLNNEYWINIVLIKIRSFMPPYVIRPFCVAIVGKRINGSNFN